MMDLFSCRGNLIYMFLMITSYLNILETKWVGITVYILGWTDAERDHSCGCGQRSVLLNRTPPVGEPPRLGPLFHGCLCLTNFGCFLGQ